MTAVTAEDTAVIDASAVLIRTELRTWPQDARPAIEEAAGALRDAIDIHELILAGDLCWEAYDPEIREYAETARYGVAVTQSAGDAEERAGYLLEIAGRLCGPEAADEIAGER